MALRRLALALACGAVACLAGARLPARSPTQPRLFLWAWERATNLERLDTRRAGVAYLAGSLLLRGDRVDRRPRLQPLLVPPGTRLVAVVRLDVDREDPPRYSPGQRSTAADAVLGFARTGLARGDVEQLQIDFDAAASGRAFYAGLLQDVRAGLPAGAGLSMTALASWCLGDPWIRGLPANEAVPMLFRMGIDTRQVRAVLAGGGGFTVPACRHSLGLSTDEPAPGAPGELTQGRRIYLFNPRGWTNESAARAIEEFSR